MVGDTRASSAQGEGRASLGLSSAAVWFVALLVISGSFCLTLVQLSKGLHEQLVVNKESLLAARKQLVQVGVEKETLLEQQHEERLKLQRLRAKSGMVSAELLEQQKRVKLLQYEVLAARQDLKGVTLNCSESSVLMEKQFNVTTRYLLSRVIENHEYHVLLNKNLKDRVVLERSVELMQNKVFDLTEQLGLAKTNLVRAAKSIKDSKVDVDELKVRLIESNEALAKASALLEQHKKLQGAQAAGM
jgi:hypothetical protein